MEHIPRLESAVLADLPVLNETSLLSKAHWGYPQDWLDHWKPGLEIKPEHLEEWQVFKFVFENEIVGFCAMWEVPEHYIVEHLWLRPQYIGRGWGWRMFSQVLDLVVKEDKPIEVEADPNAVPFYERFGFVTEGKIESYPPGRFLPVMYKRDHLPSEILTT